MPLSRKLAPYLVQALTSARTRSVRRSIAELRRRMRREPRRVLYFHQVDDPYSALVAQVLDRFLARFDVELDPHIVGPPADDAAPERERLARFSREDAAAIAPHLGLEFRDRGAQPAPELLQRAERVLVEAVRRDRFVDCARVISRALWLDDVTDWTKLEGEHPPADLKTTLDSIAEAKSKRERLGHYLGGMLYYAGEWYWGVDRLHHLERRLEEAGARIEDAPPDPVVKPPTPRRTEDPVDASELTLEFYLSLRSPYTYIAMQRVYALAARYRLDLQLRPVLPMVMRGLAVPLRKRLYIVLDTKREAELAGVPFGKICDPVGDPVERAFSLHGWAESQGRGAEYLHSFAQGSFAEGIDTGSDEGLRLVVERVGLDWEDGLKFLDGDDWRHVLELNRQSLFDLGLWGVPSFRLRGPDDSVPDLTTWGQDRLWLLEAEILERTNR